MFFILVLIVRTLTQFTKHVPKMMHRDTEENFYCTSHLCSPRQSFETRSRWVSCEQFSARCFAVFDDTSGKISLASSSSDRIMTGVLRWSWRLSLMDVNSQQPSLTYTQSNQRITSTELPDMKYFPWVSAGLTNDWKEKVEGERDLKLVSEPFFSYWVIFCWWYPTILCVWQLSRRFRHSVCGWIHKISPFTFLWFISPQTDQSQVIRFAKEPIWTLIVTSNHNQ